MFIRDHIADFPIQVMCEALGASRRGYCAWASQDESTVAGTRQLPYCPARIFGTRRHISPFVGMARRLGLVAH